MLGMMLLAILQGTTEFIPISSSGHLVLAKNFFGIEESGALIEIFLHFGTLVSILIFYRKRMIDILRTVLYCKWGNEEARMILYILWASVPAGIAGIFLKSAIENLFSNPSLALAMLTVTGMFLLSIYFQKNRKDNRLNLLNTLIVGVAQAFAILPGLSRSGMTITAGLWLGIKPQKAAEFSFLLSLPAIAGAMAIKIKEVVCESIIIDSSVVVATFVSAVVGYFSLAVLIPIISKGKIWIFGIYCVFVGICGLIFNII